MLKTGTITEKYEITRYTLNNWKTTKPNLYNLIKTSDEAYDRYRDTTIILEEYARNTINSVFSFDEIKFIYTKNLIFKNVNDIIDISTIYSATIIKDIKTNSRFVLGIYQKLEELNIIERYIFVNRLRIIKQKNIKDEVDKNDILKHYMKEFIL
jgi:hypothetical protein